MGAPKSLVEYYNEFIHESEPEHELRVDFAGYGVLVRTNSTKLIELLDEYYREFPGNEKEPDATIIALERSAPDLGLEYAVKQPDPGKKKIKEEYLEIEGGRIVRKRITGMHFLFGGEIHLAVGPCVDNYNQIINFMNNRHIQHVLQEGALLGHASAVYVHKDRAISLAGFSGAGKSTLSLHLMSRGLNFVSNDRVMVKEMGSGVRVTGVAKLPRINPGTIINNPDLKKMLSDEELEEYTSMPVEELWELERKYDAFIDEVYGKNKFHLEANMAGLVLLNWKRNNEPLTVRKIDLRDRPELLPAFKKDTGLFFQQTEPPLDFSDEAYQQLLSKVDVIEITGGVDFDGAADACIQYMETGKVG